MEVTIVIGSMADDIDKQLAVYGYKVERHEFYQNCLDSVSRLLLNGYLPPSVADKARNKIIRDVFKSMKKIGAQ